MTLACLCQRPGQLPLCLTKILFWVNDISCRGNHIIESDMRRLHQTHSCRSRVTLFSWAAANIQRWRHWLPLRHAASWEDTWHHRDGSDWYDSLPQLTTVCDFKQPATNVTPTCAECSNLTPGPAASCLSFSNGFIKKGARPTYDAFSLDRTVTSILVLVLISRTCHYFHAEALPPAA